MNTFILRTQLLRKNVPDLVTTAGDEALRFLCGLLNAAVRLSQKADECRPPDDYIWRPIIDHPHHMEEGQRGLSVTAGRNAALQLGHKIQQTFLRSFSTSRAGNGAYFIGSHLMFYGHLMKTRLVWLRNGSAIPQDSTAHIFVANIVVCAGNVSPSSQRRTKAKVLDCIQNGPDIEGFKARWEAFNSRSPTDQEIADQSKRWQRDRLYTICSHLPNDWKRCYEELIAEVGPAEDEQNSVKSAF